jgi:hypothetical protein
MDERKEISMTWTVKFTLICLAVIAAGLAAAWTVDGEGTLGLSTHGVIAMALGTIATVGLAVGLMALTFVSGHRRKTED